jgi:hypothetical protein
MVYSHMWGPNQKEESAIVLRTEAEFSDFAGGGTDARLWLISRDPVTNERTKVDVNSLRAAAAKQSRVCGRTRTRTCGIVIPKTQSRVQ